MRFRTLLAILLAFTIVAAACGDDSTTDAGDDTATDDTAADDTTADDTAADDTMADDTMADDTMVSDCPTKTEGVLTVATGEPAFLPWIAGDDPTSGEGFESALVYALAAELGFDTVEWVRTGFDEAVAPGEKDYDFNIQQYSINPERDEVVDFSDGYYEVEQAIIGAADAPIASATSLADLADYQLGAAIGTTSLDYIDNVIQPNNDASVFNDNADAKSAFDAGQVDGIVFDLPTAYFVSAVEIEGTAVIGVLPSAGGEPDELGMLFEDGSGLVTCVNEGLEALRNAGAIEALEDAWLNDGGSIPSLSE